MKTISFQYKKIIPILLLCIGYLTSSCQKEPTADFVFDKEEYTAGDTIKLTQTCQDAKHWQWTDPEGKKTDGPFLNYPTDRFDNGGTKVFKLEAFSRNEKKSATVVKNVKVNYAILDEEYIEVNGVKYKPIFKEAKMSDISPFQWFVNYQISRDNDNIEQLSLTFLDGKKPMGSGLTSLNGPNVGALFGSFSPIYTPTKYTLSPIDGQLFYEPISIDHIHLFSTTSLWRNVLIQGTKDSLWIGFNLIIF
jgi:hypothetical protein